MRFEFHFLENHHCTIPLFHHSNWGKVPKFFLTGHVKTRRYPLVFFQHLIENLNCPRGFLFN